MVKTEDELKLIKSPAHPLIFCIRFVSLVTSYLNERLRML